MRSGVLALAMTFALSACVEPPPTPAKDQKPATPATSPAPVAAAVPSGGPAMPAPAGKPASELPKTDAEWKKVLTPEQFRVMREKGTERAFTGKYWDTTTPGIYKCAACGEPLFESDAKFDSGCGWPSFFKPLAGSRLVETEDTSWGVRTEITCAKCGAHMGHVFNDGPPPTGLRYCINSVSIELVPKKDAEAQTK